MGTMTTVKVSLGILLLCRDNFKEIMFFGISYHGKMTNSSPINVGAWLRIHLLDSWSFEDKVFNQYGHNEAPNKLLHLWYRRSMQKLFTFAFYYLPSNKIHTSIYILPFRTSTLLYVKISTEFILLRLLDFLFYFY